MDALSLSDSMELLRAWGGSQVTDSSAAEHVCRILGGLPLALRLAGRYLSIHQEEVSSYAEWLDESPLSALGQTSNKAESIPLLLEKSISHLSEETLTVLAVIGRLAMAPFGSKVIASVLEQSERTVERALGMLLRYGLVNREEKRYIATHPLIRTYSNQELKAPSNLLEALSIYYLDALENVNMQALEGSIIYADSIPHILYLIDQSKDEGLWGQTIDLVNKVDGFLDLRARWYERLRINNIGINASEITDDSKAKSACLSNLGSTNFKLGNIDAALDYFQQALAIQREIEDRQGESATLHFISQVQQNLGDYEKALTYLSQALDIKQKIDDKPGEAATLNNISQIHFARGVNDNLKRAHFSKKRAAKARPPGYHTVTTENEHVGNGGPGDDQSGSI